MCIFKDQSSLWNPSFPTKWLPSLQEFLLSDFIIATMASARRQHPRGNFPLSLNLMCAAVQFRIFTSKWIQIFYLFEVRDAGGKTKKCWQGGPKLHSFVFSPAWRPEMICLCKWLHFSRRLPFKFQHERAGLIVWICLDTGLKGPFWCRGVSQFGKVFSYLEA